MDLGDSSNQAVVMAGQLIRTIDDLKSLDSSHSHLGFRHHGCRSQRAGLVGGQHDALPGHGTGIQHEVQVRIRLTTALSQQDAENSLNGLWFVVY